MRFRVHSNQWWLILPRMASGNPSTMRMALLLLFIAVMTACSKPGPASSSNGAVTQTNATATAASGAVAAETNAEPAALVQQVVFDPPGTGKDPFFPTSTRMPVENDGTNEMAVVRPILPLSSYLKLTGLWSAPPSPLAFINKTDFRPGEQGTVTVVITNAQNKLEPRQVLVRCLEIRRESVLISVDGESGQIELPLPAMP